MIVNILWSDLRLLRDQERRVPEKTPLFMIYEINGLPEHESYKETIVHLKKKVEKAQYGNLLDNYKDVRELCGFKRSSKYRFRYPPTESCCNENRYRTINKGNF